MRKFFVPVMASVLALGAVSCSKDDSENYTEKTVPMETFNLFTPLVGNDAPSVSYAIYNLTVKYPAFDIKLAANNMVAPGMSAVSFTTVEMPGKWGGIVIDGTSNEIITFSSEDPSATGAKISSLNACITYTAYNPPMDNSTTPAKEISVPGYDRIKPGGSGHYTYMQYVLSGMWKVSTFWPDMTFMGTTTTEYPGMTEAYTTDGIRYRIVMKVDKSASKIGDTADIIMYNAKFAPPAPELKAIVLKGLKLEFINGGYRISGTNVIPEVLMDGDDLLENQKYVFNSFEFTSSNNMKGGSAEFTVAGVFKGSFSGACIAE